MLSKISYHLTIILFVTGLSLFSASSVKEIKNNPKTHQTPGDSLINKIAKTFISDPKHVGLSIGIYDKGKTYTYNYGTTDKQKHILPTSNSIYEIASVTKSFTGILLAQAVIDKKIRLDDQVSKYLDSNYPNFTYKGQPIKIIDLANHTSGLPKNVPDIPHQLSAEKILAFYKKYSEKKFLSDIAKVSIQTIPGTKYNYSNAGAQLIGIILEKVYHQRYANLVKKFITLPNHMYHTGTEVTPNYVNGYDGNGNLMPRLDQWKTLPAAGYLKSNVNDMLKYIRFNIDEKNNPAVNLSHIPTFLHTDENGAAIGLYWFINKSPGGEREVMHAGGGFGTTSFCLIMPGLQKGIICLANDASAITEKELREMAAKILLSF